MFHKKNTTLLTIALLAIVPQLTICSETSERGRTPKREGHSSSSSSKSSSPMTRQSEKASINTPPSQTPIIPTTSTTTTSSTTENINPPAPKEKPIEKTTAQQIAELKEKNELLESTVKNKKLADEDSAYDYGKTYKGKLVNGICNIPTDANKAFWGGVEKAIGEIINKPTIAVIARLTGNWILNDQEKDNRLVSKQNLLTAHLVNINDNIDTFTKIMLIKKQFLTTEKDKAEFAETLKTTLEEFEAARQANRKQFNDLQPNA